MLDQDKINQVIAFVVAVATGLLAYLRGKKAGSSSPASGESAEQSLASLRDTRSKERDELLEKEVKAMRADMIMWAEATKETSRLQFAELREQLGPMQEDIRELQTFRAVLEDRERRSRR